MSLIPMFYDAQKLFDQSFGHGLLNEDLYSPNLFTRAGYIRPWRHLSRQQSGTSVVKSDKEKFHVNLDVQQFLPEEITVKTVDNTITVEGRHEEKQDEHGYVSRHFLRRYVLPKDVHIDQVQCNLSSDGILSVSVPKKALPEPGTNERVVPIAMTNVPAVKSAQAAEVVNGK